MFRWILLNPDKLLINGEGDMRMKRFDINKIY